MSEFNNVKVNKEANIYFDGKVISRTITFADNSIKTLGVMLPGEYEFNTSLKEIIEITSGELEVLISEEDGWKEMSEGMSFEVPKNASFKLKVSKIFDYCCSYLEE